MEVEHSLSIEEQHEQLDNINKQISETQNEMRRLNSIYSQLQQQRYLIVSEISRRAIDAVRQ